MFPPISNLGHVAWHRAEAGRGTTRILRPVRCLVAFAVLTVALASCGAADVAELHIVSRVTPQDVARLMKEEGYSVTLDDHNVVQWKLEGFRAHMFTAEDGEAIQFHASFSDGNATLKKVNEWNRTKRFSRTYLDDEGDPHLELDLDLAGGVTHARVVDFLKTCRVCFDTWCVEVVK